MAVDLRALAVSVSLAVLVGGVVSTPILFPAAFAAEPAKIVANSFTALFPAPIDPSKFAKYAITFDDRVSTELTHTDIVHKIGFGKRTIVSIVTTASGTYSSDAIVSPHVRYPGIDVMPEAGENDGYWAATADTPAGLFTASSFTVGSFTYYSSRFRPSA